MSGSFILLLMLQIVHHCNCLSCNYHYSCVGDEILDTSSDIECNGYYSCAFSDTDIKSNSTADIYCDGSLSCYMTNIIHHISSQEFASIYCNGLLSCSNTFSLLNNYGNIWCYGELSCSNSNISIIDGNIYCDSDRACMNSTIYSSGINYVYGHLGAQNTIFYSIDRFVYHYFYGTFSGYNSQIICGDGHTCNIICHSNGCNQLRAQCFDNNSDSCIINIDCKYAHHSEVCPNGISLNTIDINNTLIYQLPMIIMGVNSSFSNYI